MYEVLLVAYLLVALALVGLVLIQQGKGADMGASFGAGASNTVFGSSGAGSFLTRGTAVLATAFIVISLILGNLSANQGEVNNIMATDESAENSVQATVSTNADVPKQPVAAIEKAESDKSVKQEQSTSDVPEVKNVDVKTQPQGDVPK